MYSNVVVGVDGRQGGHDAATLAAALADENAEITLVSVTESSHAAGLQFDLAADECLPAPFSDEQRLCGGGAQLVGIAASTVGAGLESIALRRSADLLVVGSSRRDGLFRSLCGGDVRPLMHETPCAVAVAPVDYARDPGPMAWIGVAYDDSPESDVALSQAGLLAQRFGAHLQLCHVVPPLPASTGMLAGLVDDSEIQLAAEHELLPCAAGLDITHVYGSVGDELVAFGDRVDLVACGSRRRGPLRRIAFGSTSEHLARHLSTPLIVAPTIDTTSIERWQRARRTGSSDRQMHEPIAQLMGGGSP